MLKQYFDVIPDKKEYQGGLTTQALNEVSKWLEEAAYVGDAIPIPFIGDAGAGTLSLLSTSCRAATCLMNGGSWKDVAEIGVAGAAKAAAFLIPGDLILLDQITMVARFCGIEALDIPALAERGASWIFNKCARGENEESAIYKPRAQEMRQVGQSDTAPKKETLGFGAPVAFA